MKNPSVDIAGEAFISQIMMGDFARRFEEQKQVLLTQDVQDKKEIEEFKELGRAVFNTPAGRKFLQRMAGYTLARPVYPPPAGQSAGEYAAQRAGQMNILFQLARFLET